MLIYPAHVEITIGQEKLINPFFNNSLNEKWVLKQRTTFFIFFTTRGKSI